MELFFWLRQDQKGAKEGQRNLLKNNIFLRKKYSLMFLFLFMDLIQNFFYKKI